MIARALSLAAAMALVSMPAAAQVYRCIDADGRTTYSGMPCPATADATVMPTVSSPPPAAVQPVRPTLPAPQTRQRDIDGERKRARAIADARDEVGRIRAKNADPKKCAAARARLARLHEIRAPIYSPDWAEPKQAESLYCGYSSGSR